MNEYTHPEIAQLAHELSLSPRRHRLRQVAGLCRAIHLVEEDRDYPYSLICFQITGYRPRRAPDALLGGEGLRGDLVDLLDALSASAPIPAVAAEEALYDAAALAARFKVSTKTISRWRRRGLAGCWYVFEDGRPRLAFGERSVQRFVSRNRDLVQRGAAFQLISAAEKQGIIARARELLSAERTSLHVLTQRLAAETGRAVETLRYTLRRYDEEHPESALFGATQSDGASEEALLIAEAHATGEPVESLARRFGRTKSEIRQSLLTARVRRMTSAPIEYIYHASFDAPGAEKEILEAPAIPPDDRVEEVDPLLTRVPASLPPYLRELYRTPLLSRPEEADLFRRLNFLLHQAEGTRKAVASAGGDGSSAALDALEAKLESAMQIKNRIIQANLRLVVSIAKRHLRGSAGPELFELISDGNVALMRAVDKFDFSRGFRFSTYASWAIMRGFARSIPEEGQQRDRFQTGHDELLSAARDHRSAGEADAAQEQIRAALAGAMASLDDREQAIILRRFGVSGQEAATLDEVGRELRLSKERVRQIERQALSKLREALGEERLEALAG